MEKPWNRKRGNLGIDRHGEAAKAFNFNGVDQFIVVQDSDTLDINGDLSVSCWLKMPTGLTWQHKPCQEKSW